jgi:hypothetical protein
MMDKFSERDRVVLLLSLFARERDINLSISDAKKYGSANLDKIEAELTEIIDLQKRVMK